MHVLIHDVIPLDFPEFQRPGTVAPFRAKIQRVARFADRVIFNSDDTKRMAEAQFARTGRVPSAVTAHLGVEMAAPDRSALPAGLPPESKYFITVGTIEPRKNHAFLLDLWAEMGPDAPMLLICGQRGWRNEAVFRRLDDLPAAGQIQEHNSLSDPALAALVQGAAGLLFPSRAEGFGLPLIEALSLGTRVLCNDLPVFREIAGDKAVYAPLADRYLWIDTIKRWDDTPTDAGSAALFTAPTWEEHFKTVLRQE